MAAAAAAGDGRRFRSTMSAADPDFAATAEMLWRNLAAMPLTELTARATSQQYPLGTGRREVVGAGGWVQQVRLHWRLASFRVPSQHLVWITFVTEGQTTRIAGLVDAPAGRRSPAPLWWRHPVTVASHGPVVAVVADGQSARTWAARTARAARAVRRNLTADVTPGWDGRVLVEVPADATAFEAALGVDPGSYRAIAAAVWPEGGSPSERSFRMVVNAGAVAELSETGLAVLLQHETVHLATGSPSSPAPTWLVEGFADYIAFRNHPRAQLRAAARLLDEIRSRGTPSRLPAEAAFRPQAPRLDLAYAQAWTACRFAAQAWSPAKLGELYRRIDRGSPVDRAMRATLGVGQVEFTRQWRRHLQRLAKAG
jgi:hypothetical protein